MKTQSILKSEDVFISSSLNQLVDRLTDSLEPAIHRNKSFVINDVPENISTDINEELLASVLSRLLNMVIMHTENSRIMVSAKTYGNIILLHVKNDGCLNYDSISRNLGEIQSLAEKMGGFVGFTSFRNKLTTIAFSFTKMPYAA
jgi:glucose-6-phosphate-specific signal transduction histidine kinase